MDPAARPSRPSDDEPTTAAVPVDGTDATRTDDDAAERGRTRDDAGTPAATRPVPAPEPRPVAGAGRSTGVSWPTVVLGLVAVLAGALVLAVQLVDLDLDWSVATPAVVVAAGGVLVLLGLVSLLTGRSSDDRGD